MSRARFEPGSPAYKASAVTTTSRPHIDLSKDLEQKKYLNGKPLNANESYHLGPITKYQVENGLDMGRILQSDHACADIVYHISNEIRTKLVKYILHNGNKVGFMIDESTTMSKKSALSICLRVIGYLLHDGASNMLGKKAGMAQLLLNQFPNLILWHCSNHRLELAVNDVVRDILPICHMKSFFDKLYSIYSASPKNKKELETVAMTLSVKLNSIGRTLGTRWVSFSARSVMAVWNNYAALYQHFHESLLDLRRNGGDRAQYAGLKNKLCDINFIINMGLMLNALIELEHLSKKLQDRQTSLPDAHRLITLKYHIFQSMRNNSGEYYSQTQLAAEKFEFKGVKLQIEKVSKINQNEFFKCLQDKENDPRKEKYDNLIKNLQIFDKPQWFADQDPCFGDNDIRQLAKTLNICEITAVQGFRDYISTGDCNKTPNDLQPLRTATNTLIVSTAECERSFSTINIILSSLRNSLLIKTVSSLMFISLVGPPFTHFDPKDYVIKQFGKRHRDANFRNCEAPALKFINERETF
ncbi:E3 SUMO-protein ligase KIAA1586-like [Hydra vulgaris]|uniref:E3 SUMO-protein ligase KIAA1586-like n=1 Tax=Hydra vulgaris TaxID=6087 RepID=UPI0032E9C8FF